MRFSDEELMLQIKDGDTSAFDVMVRRWEHGLINFVFRIVGDVETAKDICQEVFLKVYQKARQYRAQSSFKTWLYRIATNCSINELKKRKRHGEVSLAMLYEENQQLEAELLDPNPQPDEIIHQNDVAKHVQTALSRLPHKQRVVIILKLYEGMNFEQIASTLGCPVSTIKSRMYCGLEQLRTMLRHLC